jgi:hypothetical protein
MCADKVFFRTVKEDRGRYFVEYTPPSPDTRFAVLDVVFPGEVEPAAVVDIMESEVKAWIARYPVAVMAFSFDGSGDLQDLTPERPCDHVIGFKEKSTGTLCLNWELLPDERIPDDALDVEWLKQVYSDIPWRTQSELRNEANKHAKQRRIGWMVVLGWVAVLPAAWAVVEWAGPQWLATIVMLYGVWKAAVKALKLLGKWKKSRREFQHEEQEQRMRHYYYHCERNPEGFLRLKVENFDCEERAEIQREAAELKARSD